MYVNFIRLTNAWWPRISFTSSSAAVRRQNRSGDTGPATARAPPNMMYGLTIRGGHPSNLVPTVKPPNRITPLLLRCSGGMLWVVGDIHVRVR